MKIDGMVRVKGFFLRCCPTEENRGDRRQEKRNEIQEKRREWLIVKVRSELRPRKEKRR